MAGMPLFGSTQPSLADVAAAPGQAVADLAQRVAASPLVASRPVPAAPPVAASTGQSDAATGGANRQAAAVTSAQPPITVGGLGRFMFGGPAMDAAAAANTQADQGSMAQALGSGVRAVGDAAVHAYAAPIAAVGQGLGMIGHAAAGAVNNFAAGLMGSPAAAAVPAQVAAPAVVPAPVPPSAAVTAVGADGQLHMAQPQTEAGARAVLARMAQADAANPVPAAAAAPTQAAATAPAAQPSPTERELGLEAGYISNSIHQAPPSKRAELIQLYSNLRGPEQQNIVRGQVVGMMNDKYRAAMTAAGADAAKQGAAKAEMLKDLLSISSPQAFAAGYMPGALQQQ